MNYILLDRPDQFHDTFRRRFTLPYGAFCRTNAQWLSALPLRFRRGYTQAYFERLPYSDRLRPEFTVLPFSEALDQLARLETVLFLTNAPTCMMHDHAALGTDRLWTAQATGAELANAIREDWFTQYDLWEREMYDPEPLFGSEVFAFTADLRRCLVFTHETDETELPQTRVCLSFIA